MNVRNVESLNCGEVEALDVWKDERMYVCIYVCMYACMYVCMYTLLNVGQRLSSIYIKNT